MGAACGCDGNSATTNDEVRQVDLKTKDTPAGTPHAPLVQGKTAADARNPKHTTGTNAAAPSSRSYEAKSEEQMTRLQQMVV